MRQRAAAGRALCCSGGARLGLLRAGGTLHASRSSSSPKVGLAKRRPLSSFSAAGDEEAPPVPSASVSSTTTSTSPTPAPTTTSRGEMRDGAAKWSSSAGQAGGRPQQQPQGARGEQQRKQQQQQQQQQQQHRQRQRQQNDSTARSPPSELPTQTSARAHGRPAAGAAATSEDQRPDARQQEQAAASEDGGSGGSGGIPQPRPWFQRESPEVGYVYRRYRETKPNRAEQQTVKPLPLLTSIWKPLELTLPQQTVPPPVEIPVARLAHGLKRVVLNEGVHPLKDFTTHKYLFSPFLSKIHQPEDINFNSMPPFITTSKDKILHKLAAEHGVKYKGSTSSMSPTLAQIYRLLSNFKGPSFPQMSPYYRNKPASFTKTSVKPVCLFLRPVDGIYSIDSDPGNIPIAANQILLDLGKSLERMLTTEPQDFKREFLLSGNPTGQYSGPEAYHYLKMGDFLLRSQLDCHEPDLPGENKTFDLKTRATTMVRRNMLKYQKYLKYKLTCLQGGLYSYEREFYDICRAAMLKYWYQVRIGKMDGIFVAYHNTAELFGFEYLKADEMERVLFGSSELAEVAFQVPIRLWQNILNEITARAPPNKTLRVVLNTDKIEKEMDVFVEPVEFDSGWLEPAMSVSSGDIGMISAKTNGYGYINQTIQRSSMLNSDNPPKPELELERYEWLKVGKLQPSLNHYKLRLITFVNGQPTEDRPLQYHSGDRLDVFYNLQDVTGTTEKTILKMLQSYKYLLAKSLLYAREEEEEEKLLDGAAEEDADTDEE